MILNSRSSNFIFKFPNGFISKEIEDKYLPYVKRHPLPYDTVASFIASTIQSISFPSISMEPVTQTRLYGKKQEYKNSVPLEDLFSRNFSVTMKTVDGYVNYWIMLENILSFLNFKNETLYFDDMYLRFLDQEGHIMNTTRFNKVLFNSMSEISMSYSDNNPDFKTFDLSFSFNRMELMIEKG